jgi:uncharacterized protein YndB with AHSA1/START domain
MTSTAQSTQTTQVFRVFIKATPERVWQAITDPEWNYRYGYQCRQEYDLEAGGAYRSYPSQEMKDFGAPDVIIDGEILECDPPHRLVQTWHALWSEELITEPATRVTYELRAEGDGRLTRLTVTHELEGAPVSAVQVAGEQVDAGGGWPYILSDLKTFLESGAALNSA